jgi:hypothetical protein
MKHYASDHAIPAAQNDSAPRRVESSPAVPGPGDGSKPEWLLEAERRLSGYKSLLETLTEEDWEFFRTYDGPEVLGPPPPPPMKRRPRRRGEG